MNIEEQRAWAYIACRATASPKLRPVLAVDWPAAKPYAMPANREPQKPSNLVVGMPSGLAGFAPRSNPFMLRALLDARVKVLTFDIATNY
jgi:hypothetical protein